MAQLVGCHVIAKGDPAAAAHIVPSILSQGLLIQQTFLGVGAWAYYVDMVLKHQTSKPIVVFEVDSTKTRRVSNPLPSRPDFAFMQILGSPLTYAQVNILGFLNLPGFPVYSGLIGVV